MMSDDNVQILVALGLGVQESKLYLAMGHEKQTVSNLAKKLNVARTSVYAGLEKLAGRGLLEVIVKYKRKLYSRAKVEMLGNLVEEEKKKVEKMEERLQVLGKILSGEMKRVETEVRYYHGRQGFQQMMWNALSADKETVGWSEFGRVEVVGEKFIETWVEEFKRRGLRDRVLANPTKKTWRVIGERVGKPGHQLARNDIKLISEKEMYISGDTTIYNNIFAVCWWNGGEVVGIEIENPELVRTQKTMFETLWRRAQRIS